MKRALLLVCLCACTTTLEFDGVEPDGSIDGSSRDEGMPPEDTGPAPDRGVDVGVNDGCEDACLAQLSECRIFDGPLCQQTCLTAPAANIAAFAACAESIASQSNCNFGQTTCFSNLTGGSSEESSCRAACDRYEDCNPVFVASQNCEERCGTRLPEGNEAFIQCVDDDIFDCTLGCL